MRRDGKVPRFKRQRRLQVELPGLGKPGAMERKPYPPGEQGNRRRKFSDYALQLEEKQKILYHYGLRESQLRRLVDEAKRARGEKWMDELISLLERRLDSVVFRLGFAPSIRTAKQLISHGHVRVNGLRVDIRSVILKVGDEVTLTPAAHEIPAVMQAKSHPRVPLPDFLRLDAGDTATHRGVLRDRPRLGDAPFPLHDDLVTSYYNLKG